MPQESRSVLIAYDGSELSKAALQHAAELFRDFRAVVVTVWEPELPELSVIDPGGGTGLGGGFSIASDPAMVEEIDDARHGHAERVAGEGAELARSLGLAAEPHAVPDEVDVADTLIDLAREQRAAALVVGSHGISGLRSRLLGGVSRKVIDHCDRPVLVVRGESH